MVANLINFEQLLPFAIFGLFAVVVWWLLDRVSAGKSRADERLDELRNPKSSNADDLSALKKTGALTKVLERASPALSKPLQPKSEEAQSKLRNKMASAGFRGETAGMVFYACKMATLSGGLFLGTGAMFGLGEISIKTLGIASVFGGLGYYLPEIVLWFFVKNRKDGIFYGLPDALDLMVVCVEAGLGLDQAMRKVSEEMKGSYRVLSQEFELANFQLQMGRPRTEVLHELGARTGVSDLRSLAAVLIQADKFGSSVAVALRVQSDSMRTRRRQLAEEKAAKTAVKLIFPLVLFIFPGIFVVLVGPAAITMVRELFPMMGGGG